jgi:hypothetical protein
MSKIDFVFVILGIFCYFSTMMKLKEQDTKVAQYEEIQKKKRVYANYMQEQKKRESLAKAATEKRNKRKMDIQGMTSAMEQLTALSDIEVMRQSHITNGKY